MELQEVRDRGAAILDELERAIVGKRDALELILVAMLCDGHVLLEDYPGLAKTLAARSFAQAASLRFSRIQFTPDLMPSDVTGSSVFDQRNAEFTFLPGPIFTNLLLADEINRAPAKTQSALLEAMGERQVTVDGVSRPLDPLFTVYATQNPVEHEGTYPLPEAQLDRFLLKTVIPYPSADAEREMLAHHEAGFDPERAVDAMVPAVTDRARALELRALVDQVRVAPEVRDYITAITRVTRDESSLSLGASPRATVALMRAARAAAVLEGRAFVVPDDVKDRVHAALRHRVTLSPELEVEGRSADDVLSAILLRIEAPK